MRKQTQERECQASPELNQAGVCYVDNQGLCHYCGRLMEPEWWRLYAGKPHPDEERSDG